MLAGEVTLVWRTVAETPGARFQIQRAAARDGPYLPVNGEPLPATGAPAVYRLTDRPPAGVTYYRLADTDSQSTTRLRGPVAVTVAYRIYLPAIQR